MRRKSDAEVSRRKVIKREPYYDYFNVSGSLCSREEKAASREQGQGPSLPRSPEGLSGRKRRAPHMFSSPHEPTEKEQMQLTSVYERKLQPFNVDKMRSSPKNEAAEKEPPRAAKLLAGDEAQLGSSSS